MVAVAARKQPNAQEFATKYDLKKSYGSYKELAEDEEVDVAYIGVICPQHFRVVKMMLNAGKKIW